MEMSSQSWLDERFRESLELSKALFDALCGRRRSSSPSCDCNVNDGGYAFVADDGVYHSLVNGNRETQITEKGLTVDKSELARVLGALRDSSDGSGGFLAVEGSPPTSFMDCDSAGGVQGLPATDGREQPVQKDEFLRAMREVYGIVGRRAFDATLRAQIMLALSRPSREDSFNSVGRRLGPNLKCETDISTQQDVDVSLNTMSTPMESVSRISPNVAGGPHFEGSKTPLSQRRCWTRGMHTSVTPCTGDGDGPQGLSLLTVEPMDRSRSCASNSCVEPNCTGVCATTSGDGQVSRTTPVAAGDSGQESPRSPWDLDRRSPSPVNGATVQERTKHRAQTMTKLAQMASGPSRPFGCGGTAPPSPAEGNCPRRNMLDPSPPSAPVFGRLSDDDGSIKLRHYASAPQTCSGGAVTSSCPPTVQGRPLGELHRRPCEISTVETTAAPVTSPLPALDQMTRSASSSAEPESAERQTPQETMIFFDWDDTLSPTTFIQEDPRLHWSQQAPCFSDATIRLLEGSPRGSASVKEIGGTREKDDADQNLTMMDALRRHVEVASTVLRAATSCGKVVIVTLAKKGWVETCCKNFLPGLFEVIQDLGIDIVYARSCLAQWKIRSASADNLDLMMLMKQAAMSRCLRRMHKRRPKQRWKNALSIGDSSTERDALSEVSYLRLQYDKDGIRQRPCRCKTVKLPEEPDILQLTAELEALAGWISTVIEHDGDVDLDLSNSSDAMATLEQMQQSAELGALDSVRRDT
eukprot:TRINITY_DN24446_c0_g1_i1.p1 TRINITY_DN24446_c0_g1~~TRINITY_DN24446_c0_g1_i1.p1  ORF type:complete len:787 (-),score=115.11 TRINITY_DN24446_c0_g1_i1:159-2417(-)